MGDIASKWFQIGYISMLLFMLNWVLIVIFGFATFRMKKLHRNKRMYAVEKTNEKEEDGIGKKNDNGANTQLLSTTNGHTNYSSQSMLHHRFEKNGKENVTLEAV